MKEAVSPEGGVWRFVFIPILREHQPPSQGRDPCRFQLQRSSAEGGGGGGARHGHVGQN